jgi:DNA invertase Pin-like site-specific DNA recombinase
VSEEPVQAAIYCRISLSTMGDTTKVEDQERICRLLCEQIGWHVVGVYTDNNKSAWQRSVRRREWERMLADIEAGKITGIVTYHGDRLVRQPRDLEKLIDLANGKGIRLASPTGTRNLDKRDDRAMARVIATFAENESAALSERRQLQYQRWRREGKVRAGGRGGRPFGFGTDCATHIPGETAIIREAAARVLNGESAGAISRDISARGWRTPAGNPFTHSTLRKMLARPRLAGLMPDGISSAAWDPVLPREEWESLVAVLDAKAAAFGYASNARRYLLSGIAMCGVCGATLRTRAAYHRPGATGYACVEPGCKKVYRSVTLLDRYVAVSVVAVLNNPATPRGRVPAVPGLAAEMAALAAERAAVEAAVADHTKGRLHLLLGRLDSLDARLAELRELTAAGAQAHLLGVHAGISIEEFEALPLGVRRALVSACYRVTVLPASARGPGFRTEDVLLAPR